MNSLGSNGPGGYTEIFMCQIWANSTIGINWHDYNYPPILQLMHYDKDCLLYTSDAADE